MAWIYVIGRTQPWTYYSDQAKNNANEFASYFMGLGYTIESICGMLGNIDYESFLNPGQGQIGSGSGLGLIQWTPSTQLTNYITGTWYDGNVQCEVIHKEIFRISPFSGSGVRWIPTSAFPYNGQQFSQLTNVQTATDAYFYERERPGDTTYIQRRELAAFWYEYFQGHPPTPSTPVNWLYMVLGNHKSRKLIL